MGRRTPRWSNTRRAVRRPGEHAPARVSRWETALIWLVPNVVLAIGIAVAVARDIPLCGRSGECEDGGVVATLVLAGLVIGSGVGIVYLLGWRGPRR